jgi:hypothetical protein
MGLEEPQVYKTWCLIIITSKHENISVVVQWDGIGVNGWKLLGQSNDIQCLAEGETEGLVKKVIFHCIVSCMSSYILFVTLLTTVWFWNFMHHSLQW